MKTRYLFLGLATCLGVVCGEAFAPSALAGLGGRGMGGGGRGMGGGGRAMGGGGRAMSGGGRSYGGGRPGNAVPAVRPQSSMPHLGNQSMGRPAARPSLPGNVSRPSVTSPNLSRPGAQRPANSLPGAGNRGQRPATRPANSNPGGRLPNRGDVAGGSARPGNATRPARPNVPGSSARPNLPDFGRLPAGRPTPQDVGDFLDLNQAVRPEGRPTTLPATRPGARPGTRPGGPGTTRPERPNLADRPGGQLPSRRPNISVGDVNIGNNNVISNRPSWANIDQGRVNQINRRWQNGIAGGATTLPAYAGDWGDRARNHWNDHWHGRPPHYFGPNWWARHPYHCGGWHYFYRYSMYPYGYWWGRPAYPSFATWFLWWPTAPSMQQPVYYDYGSGGNVVYQNNNVTIGGEVVATSEEYAQSAAALATVAPPESEEAAQEAEWLPLGTFALMTDEDDVDPSRIVQLAVNKEGVVAGSIYNKETDQTQAIQGRVDKETQRVAMRIGTSEEVVAETGLYNLTQDEASVLVHFGAEQRDSYLLVRLPEPEDDEADAPNEP
ncbi:MAG: hypothetical protein KDA61_12945 [Planctomycetales bacterium]|nr:hypothetical protein [Planctomycetales bacterium]